MGFTEKQQDKFSREFEKGIHRKLEKVSGASDQEIAVTQLETARELLRDTEPVDKLIGPDVVIKPSDKSDGTPNDAKQFMEKTRSRFKSNYDEIVKNNPKVGRITRVWAVGIQLQK